MALTSTPPRPAAAVAPMVQTNNTLSVVSDVVLGMTTVTSLSYTGSNFSTQKLCLFFKQLISCLKNPGIEYQIDIYGWRN